MSKRGVLSITLAAALTLLSLAPESFASHRHHARHARIYHHHHHHHSAFKKIAGIGAPIAVGMTLGPAGSVGYQVVKHRKAIKHHLIRH
ncbi:MAG TPA: hypothetical protein VKA60_26510 [Blastocatellia bacterium]|nr:hypothetical protein [Blastocatellia bacterium]